MLNWLFEIGPTASPTYRLALADMTYNSNAYTGVVDPESFSGVTLNRVKVELDQITRSEISFNIVGSYTLSALIGQPLVIREVTGSDVTDMLGAWRFRIESAASAYGVITVTAVDQLSSVMDGVWPNTPLVRNVFPEAVFSHAGLDESACIPVVFGGSSYIPVQSKSVSGEVFFIIGTGAGGSHTITAITSPNNIDSPISYTVNTDIWVEGSSDGTYEFFQPFREVGLVTPVFWRSGADRAAPFVQYSKTGMSGYTNPVDILRYVLEDCGIASVDFDSTWDSVATAVDARGYTYSRGFYQYTDRPKLICHLLAACDCNIYQSGNRVSIALNSKTSVTTVDSSDVIKTRMEDHGDFSWDRVLPAKNDSGEINYFAHGTPQTKLVKAIVTASGTTTTPSTDTLDIGGVSSSTAAQKLGTLYYLKKYCRNGECSFTGHPDLISLVPGQVVTINDTLYGPSVAALVESVRINRDSTVKVTCSTYSTAFVDFEDLSVTAISPVSDTATGAITTLSQATGYTDSELENFDPPDTSTWNNRNDTAITAPTISGSGTAVDHVINTDGSANISFEWSWSGDEAVIDGFQVYWYASSSGSTYTFGTDTPNEQTAPVLPDCRAIICPSVAANKYYSFAVRAYRKVDPDVDASGLIVSTKVSPSLGSENPYLPSATVAFAGDITGTLNGTAVATVVSNAGTGATHAGTAHAPSNADVTQVVLNAGAAIDNAKVNGQVLVVGGYINASVLEITSSMIVGQVNWSTQVGGTGKPSDYADRTVTVIEAGVITTGTIQVYYGSSGLTAGITGQTSGDTSVRIWAGASFANRNSAPFRVTQAGAVTCSNITITGGSIGSAATINGTAASTVVSQAYAGSYHSTTQHAPADADKTSLNTALDTLAVGGLSSSTIAGWRYGSTVYIDGGDIYAGSVTAYQIKANTITAAQIYGGTITANEIAGLTITGDKIAGNTITGAKIITDTITLAHLKAADTGSITFTGCVMTFANGADLVLQSTSDSSSVLKMQRSGYEYQINLHSSGSYLRLSPKNGVGTGGIVIGYDSVNMAYACGIVASNNIGFSIGTSTAYSLQNDGFYPLVTGKVLGLQSYPWNNIFGSELMLGNTGASGVTRVKSLGRGAGTTTYGWVHQNSSSQTRFQVRDDGEVLSGHHSPVANDTYYCGTSTAARWAGAYIAYANVVGMNPPTANTGYVGSASYYYNTCYINNIRYKTSSTFDLLDDLDVIHSMGPALDENGDPIPEGDYGLQLKPMSQIHPAITNYSQLADVINSEWGTTLTFQDLQGIVSETLSAVQADDIDLYAADFPDAFIAYAGKLDVLMADINQMIAGEIEGPVTIPGPLIDKDYIESRIFFDAGSTMQLSLGAHRQLDLFVTDDVVEQFNSLIETLTSRLTAAETALSWFTSERIGILGDLIDWFTP